MADIDVDGNLAADEFCVAMYLIDMAKMGQPLPTTLPPGLVPPSMRRLRRPSETPTAAQVSGKLFLYNYVHRGIKTSPFHFAVVDQLLRYYEQEQKWK